MGHNALTDSINGVRSRLQVLFDRLVPVFAKLAANRLTLRIGSDSDPLDAIDVLGRYEELEKIVVEWPEFLTVREFFQTDAILVARQRTLEDHATLGGFFTINRFILAGAGRVVYLASRGVGLNEAMEQAIDGYLDLVRAVKRETEVIVTVPGLLIGDAPLTLDVNTEMRTLTDDECKIAYERNPKPVPVSTMPGIIVRGLTRSTPDFRSVYLFRDTEALEVSRSVLAFLQLMVDDRYRPERIVIRNRKWFPTRSGFVTELETTLQPYVDRSFFESWGSDPMPEIDAKVRDELVTSWPSFTRACENTRIRRAVNRFGLSVHRDSDEDSLLDQCIALESLLSPGSAGITDAIATRCALLVGTDLAERVEIRRQVRALYDVRSGVVHGDDLTSRLKRLADSLSFKQATSPPEMSLATWVGRYFVKRCLLVAVAQPELIAEFDELLLIASLRQLKALRKFFGSKPGAS